MGDIINHLKTNQKKQKTNQSTKINLQNLHEFTQLNYTHWLIGLKTPKSFTHNNGGLVWLTLVCTLDNRDN